jgi:hypothetical protein
MAEEQSAGSKPGGTIDIAGKKIPVMYIGLGLAGIVGLYLLTKFKGSGPSANVGDQSLNQAIGALNSQIQQIANKVTTLEPVGGTVPTTPAPTPANAVVYNPSVGTILGNTGGRTPGPDSKWLGIPDKLPTGASLTWLNPTTIDVKYKDYTARVTGSPTGAGYHASYGGYYGKPEEVPTEFKQSIQAAIHAMNPGFIGSYQ